MLEFLVFLLGVLETQPLVIKSWEEILRVVNERSRYKSSTALGMVYEKFEVLGHELLGYFFFPRALSSHLRRAASREMVYGASQAMLYNGGLPDILQR